MILWGIRVPTSVDFAEDIHNVNSNFCVIPLHRSTVTVCTECVQCKTADSVGDHQWIDLEYRIQEDSEILDTRQSMRRSNTLEGLMAKQT